MEKANLKIRRAAEAAGVPHWQIAQALGMAEATFSRKLREEFPPEMRERVLIIINDLEQKRKEGAQEEAKDK